MKKLLSIFALLLMVGIYAQTVQKVQKHTRKIEFSKDGSKLLTSRHGKVTIWSDKGTSLGVIETGLVEILDMSIVTDNGYLLTCGKNKAIKLWNIEDKSLIKTFTTNFSVVTTAAMSNDGKYLACGSKTGKVVLFDALSGTHLETYNYREKVRSVAFNNSGELLAAGGESGYLNVYSTRTHGVVLSTKEFRSPIYDVEFANVDDVIVCGSSNQVYIISASGYGNTRISCDVQHAYEIEVSPDFRYAVVGSSTANITLLDLKARTKIKMIKVAKSSITGMSFSADGKKLAVNSYSNASASIIDPAKIGLDIDVENPFIKEMPKKPEVAEVVSPVQIVEQPVAVQQPVQVIQQPVAAAPAVEIDDEGPKIILTAPSGFLTSTTDSTDADNVEVIGTVFDNKGVAKLLVNDVNVPVRTNGTFSQTIPLHPGENKIYLECYDYSNNMTLQKYLLVKTGSAPVAMAEPSRAVAEPEPEPVIANTVDASHSIDIIQPTLSNDRFLQKDKKLKIKGQVNSEDGFLAIMVNGEPAKIINKQKGYFEAQIEVPYMESDVKVEFADINKKSYEYHFTVNRPVSAVEYAEASKNRNGRDYALIFATNDFDEHNDLTNPVYDGQTIAQELEENYNFDVKTVLNPSLNEIYTTLREYSDRLYNDGDQLFIFFAGHGEFDHIFKEGYIVAKDSKADDMSRSSMLSHSNLRNIVNNIPCGHIFITLDVCFGGTFDQMIAQRGNPGVSGDKLEFINRKLRYKTRLYLTSGGKEYVPDGRPGAHSPFAKQFIQALRDQGGEDGILTYRELLTYIESLTPEPRMGEFGNNEPGSDFLFISNQP